MHLRELENVVQPLPHVVELPNTTLSTLHELHRSTRGTHNVLGLLAKMLLLERQTPELRNVRINPGNNGQYQVVDKSAWPAKSIGILNAGAAPVFLGIGGVSARPTSGAPSCPGASALVLPVEVQDLEIGCDPAVLLGTTAVVVLFRYVTVQPLSLSGL